MKEKILENISTGKWSYNELHPLFHNAIEKEFLASDKAVSGSRDIPLFVKSLLCFSKKHSLSVGWDIQDIYVEETPYELHDFFRANGIPGIHVKQSLEQKNTFKVALSKIGEMNQETKVVFDTYINGIVSLKHGNFFGSSHPHLWGCIMFGEKFWSSTTFDKCISIVHEMGHQELFLINTIDRLVNDGFEYNLLHAPFQNKVRPPIGRLHSLMALYRMVQFERAAGQKETKNTELLSKNINAFEKKELTSFGYNLVKSIEIWLEC